MLKYRVLGISNKSHWPWTSYSIKFCKIDRGTNEFDLYFVRTVHKEVLSGNILCCFTPQEVVLSVPVQPSSPYRHVAVRTVSD